MWSVLSSHSIGNCCIKYYLLLTITVVLQNSLLYNINRYICIFTYYIYIVATLHSERYSDPQIVLTVNPETEKKMLWPSKRNVSSCVSCKSVCMPLHACVIKNVVKTIIKIWKLCSYEHADLSSLTLYQVINCKCTLLR